MVSGVLLLKKSQLNALSNTVWGHTEDIEREKTSTQKYTVIALDLWRYELFWIFQIWGQNTLRIWKELKWLIISTMHKKCWNIENLWPCHHKISIEELVAIFCSHMSHHQLEDGRAEMNNHAFPHIILGSTHNTLSVLLRNFVSILKS